MSCINLCTPVDRFISRQGVRTFYTEDDLSEEVPANEEILHDKSGCMVCIGEDTEGRFEQTHGLPFLYNVQ